MKIGWSQRKITPLRSARLGGFAAERFSQGVHDDLYVKALAIVTDQGPRYMLTIDVLGADDTFLDRLHRMMGRQGLDPSALVVFCSHTHSAPVGLSRFTVYTFVDDTDVDEGWVDTVLEAGLKALNDAAADVMDFSVTAATGDIVGVGSNRDDRSRPGDPQALALAFTRTDGRRCLLYNYSCHPTVLGSSNLMITADLPGQVASDFSAEYQQVMFINGSCGDISTRYNRRRNGFPELQRMGAIVHDALDAMLAKPFYQGPLTRFAIDRHDMVLQYKTAVDADQAAADVRRLQADYDRLAAQGQDAVTLKNAHVLLEGAMAVSNYAASRYPRKKTARFTVSLIHVGDIVIVTVPFELFSQLSKPLKDRYHVFFAGYADGYLAYLPDQEAYRRGFYEAGGALAAPGQGERLMEAIDELLARDGVKTL